MLKKKKEVYALYPIPNQISGSAVSPAYNFAILMRGLCSTPAKPCSYSKCFPIWSICLLQHTALLSGGMLSFVQVLYT